MTREHHTLCGCCHCSDLCDGDCLIQSRLKAWLYLTDVTHRHTHEKVSTSSLREHCGSAKSAHMRKTPRPSSNKMELATATDGSLRMDAATDHGGMSREKANCALSALNIIFDVTVANLMGLIHRIVPCGDTRRIYHRRGGMSQGNYNMHTANANLPTNRFPWPYARVGTIPLLPKILSRN